MDTSRLAIICGAMLCRLPFGATQTPGPGNGRWVTATPESQGLDSRALEIAEQEVNREVGERNCFIVVKNGVIVKETYRRGRTAATITELASHTKSLCSSLYGVAVQRKWASPADRITDRDWNPRECNRDALFQNVLTMTGQSADLRAPEFYYDASGFDCLDTLQDFIRLNNPDGERSAVDWKDKYWAEPLGLEHSRWGGLGYLNCGFSAQFSCRDAARVGVLWANNGAWKVDGQNVQLVDEEYAKKARTSVYPEALYAWGPYGYTLWLWGTGDRVDPTVTAMAGADAQCTFISHTHNAVIVSFGLDEDENCDSVWQRTKNAIVSDAGSVTADATADAVFGPRGSNGTRAATGGPVPDWVAARALKLQQNAKRELPALREYLVHHMDQYSAEQIERINVRLVKHGGEPVTIASGPPTTA